MANKGNTYKKKKDRVVRQLRVFRKWHRYLGLSLTVLLVVSSLTGILLAWKKNVDLLQPPTQKGRAVTLTEWKSLDELSLLGQTALQDSIGQSIAIDRMDVRPSKGIVKVLFKKGNWEVQLDGSSGKVLSVAKRHADWIEHLHDGSIISQSFKLVSMNILGVGLLLLIFMGIWIWYGPHLVKRLRKRRIRERSDT